MLLFRREIEINKTNFTPMESQDPRREVFRGKWSLSAFRSLNHRIYLPLLQGKIHEHQLQPFAA